MVSVSCRLKKRRVNSCWVRWVLLCVGRMWGSENNEGVVFWGKGGYACVLRNDVDKALLYDDAG